MPKYHFKVNTEIVREQWGVNTEMPFPIEGRDITATLIVEAEDEADALAQRGTISYIPAWELTEVEE